MNGIQIEINGVTYQGFAYQAADGLLIHLPGVQSPDALAFDALFQPLPEDRACGGFVEAGEWNGGVYAFEGNVLFGLGPDGAVWARICNSLDELPQVNVADDPTTRAWRMLAEAEEAFGVQSMARERAACGNWPRPVTPSDYLMWLEDEAAIQEQQAADHPEEAAERTPYARALRGLAGELRQLGFEPSPAPWTIEEGAA